MSLQIEILEQSFWHIRDCANDFAESFYKNLLQDYPQLQPLFSHTNMVKQRRMLFSALVFLIENLRNPEVFNQTLKDLGSKHVQYGILPEHYLWFSNTLLKTLEQYLKQDWTEEVKQAWHQAFDTVIGLMATKE